MSTEPYKRGMDRVVSDEVRERENAAHDHGPESRCGLYCPAIQPPIDLDVLEAYLKKAVEQGLSGRRRQVAWTSSPELVLALIAELRNERQRREAAEAMIAYQAELHAVRPEGGE